MVVDFPMTAIEIEAAVTWTEGHGMTEDPVVMIEDHVMMETVIEIATVVIVTAIVIVDKEIAAEMTVEGAMTAEIVKGGQEVVTGATGHAVRTKTKGGIVTVRMGTDRTGQSGHAAGPEEETTGGKKDAGTGLTVGVKIQRNTRRTRVDRRQRTPFHPGTAVWREGGPGTRATRGGTG